MLAARPLAVLLALIACAWFALGFRQARDTDRASTIVSAAALTPNQTAQAASLLRAAATLNPDREVDMLRGRLALRVNDRVRAVQTFEQVSREEPMNIEPWVWLTRSATSAKIFASALAAIGRLAPHVRATP